MGLRLKKRAPAPPEPPLSSTLMAFSLEDLYLLVESSLMNAQQRMTQYRTAGREDKLAHLEWLRSDLLHASTGARVLESKILSS